MTAVSWSSRILIGTHAVKLAAGDMVVYPASSLQGAAGDPRRPRGGFLLGAEHGA